ncbi:2',3'-cyclic-nucleotide 3'-phosphodiesterase-like isoform X2 [Penaeus japonicus]|uniref:2',3'-cyclic-nucleotide 3'-phosphodiesterase-like isoform X2 n=1 Tax=Penaeus japonicus TaxID=27405 RepID=UPI001C711803|nr:2',3'-cyclic-nucleotide 3'-phosphodiesterase-like isoform X2 [Penaeus japonicus]
MFRQYSFMETFTQADISSLLVLLDNINKSTDVEVDKEMGQTVSQIGNKLFPSQESPSKVEDTVVEIDETDTAAVGASPVSSSPKYPLATPRKHLRQTSITRKPSETSISETPSKRFKGDTTYLNFPFLLDEKTIDYIQNNKVMFIMKGLPGSGKSTIVKSIQSVYKDSVVCSADFYFMRSGKYKFRADKLKQAHQACQNKATASASRGMNVIIIDNTNVRNWEMKFYLHLASEYLYVPVIVEPQTPWCRDAHELAERNSHGVEKSIIEQKVKSYQEVLPLYFGWFLNEADSHSILKISREWLKHCLQVKDFFKVFSAECGLSSREELLTYFNRSSFVDGGGTLHATAKFTARGKAEDAMEYIDNPIVKEAQAQVFSMDIIGYVITPFTIGARIKLTPSMLQLWGNDDEEVMPENLTGNEAKKADKKHQGSTRLDANENSDSISDPSIVISESCQNTVIAVPQDLTDRFCPMVGKGSRAHITLGCAPGVKPVRTGFDMIKAVALEQRAKERGEFGVSNPSEQSFNVPGGVLRTYGEECWIIYPENKLVVSAIFSSYN